jgi:hypothetical protein
MIDSYQFFFISFGDVKEDNVHFLFKFITNYHSIIRTDTVSVQSDTQFFLKPNIGQSEIYSYQWALIIFLNGYFRWTYLIFLVGWNTDEKDLREKRKVYQASLLWEKRMTRNRCSFKRIMAMMMMKRKEKVKHTILFLFSLFLSFFIHILWWRLCMIDN